MKKSILSTLLILLFIIGCSKEKTRENKAEKVTPPEKTVEVKEPVKAEKKHKSEENKPLAKLPVKDTVTTPPQKVTEEKKSKEELTVQELWQKYREHREASKAAFNNSEFQQTIKNLKLAGQYAIQLQREDLAAWQYNNIGYYSILEFKGRTNYDFRTNQLRRITNEKEKQKYLEETKQLFNENMKILTDAQVYLEKAYKIDEKFDEQSRTDKIYSNLQFIDWVNNFLRN